MKKNTNNKTSLKKVTALGIKKSVTAKRDFYIAGIGASAGGLEALKLFFDNMPSISGIAFVIVQHLDPTHKSLLSELLARHTKMKVAEVTDGILVEPDHVYIIPPNKDLKIINGFLQLKEPAESRNVRRSIDSFFHSLAEDQKDKAIGIVLSGTGSEGTLGLKDIKAAGGITFVQDPKTANFPGMPQSAIVARSADFILPPQKMPKELLRNIKNLKPKGSKKISDLTVPDQNQLKKILLLIRNQTGYDFSNYKSNTIVRRIMKRIAFHQIDSIDDYIQFLHSNPTEIEDLYKDFLIGVTSFFRDIDVFKSIEKKAIPHLLEKCIDKQELRVWVCGCSTGEEAYTLAILFREALEKNKQFIKVTIFASDIDKEAIEIARSGTYSDSTLANVSAARLSHYFLRHDNYYQLRKEIREMVVFAHHNIIKDPPFSKMDMISCRNLLIYMNSDLQKKIIPIFHYALNEEGILLLGTSESIGEYADIFTPFDNKLKIYKKKSEVITQKNKRFYELPFAQSRSETPQIKIIKSGSKKINISNLTDKILIDHYAPPSVIIDKNNNVLYFSGNTGLYLKPPDGEATFNVLEMSKKGLKADLDAAIKKARINKAEVKTSEIQVKVNDHYQSVTLLIKPVLSKETELGALMVIFETSEKLKNIGDQNKKTEKIKDKTNSGQQQKISQLEKELKLTSEHLQLAVNELETSNEDLQTTNEEYQSTNEELQSTNEELETSREELQSVNEELITVNSELSTKIDQLSQSNDDLNNLLASIEVATVYLDRKLNIKRFTPAATKIFNLIPSDIDRPVTHLSGNIVYKSLTDDVKSVLKTLVIKSANILANDGTWYQMRILPYRTTENIIEGVLVTFVDITSQKSTEEKLKKANEHLNLIMENLPAVPFTCIAGPEIKISFIGASCEKVMGFLPEQFTNKSTFWLNRIHPADKKKVHLAFSTISKKGSYDLTFRWKCANGKYKHFINYIRFVASENGRPAYIVGVWQVMLSNNIVIKEEHG